MITFLLFLMQGTHAARDLQRAADWIEKGDCPSAVPVLEKLTSAPDRNVASRALFSLARCRERAGHPDAQRLFRRIIEGFPEQTDVTAAARARLRSGTPATVVSHDPLRVAVYAKIEVGAAPQRVAVTPDGGEAWVTNQGDGTVSVIDTASNVATAAIETGEQPDAIAISPDGSLVFVGDRLGGMVIIGTRTKRVEKIDTGGPIRDLAVTRDGQSVWLAMRHSGLKTLSPATRALRTVSAAACPESVAISPDGRWVYVNYRCTGLGGVPGHDVIARFDAATGKLLDRVTGLANVGGPTVISPDGSTIWADGGDACNQPLYDHAGCQAVPSSIINIISAARRRVLRVISVAGPPSFKRLTFFPDGSLVAIGVGRSLSLFDAKTFSPVGSVPVASTGSLAFHPDGVWSYAPIPDENAVAVLRISDRR